ncbi:MAG: 30S ribosomal protein S2 [Candidatus Aenigmatarchaeota archaeon]
MTNTEETLLVPREKYLSAGIHIGMVVKTASMKRFIYKVRSTGLAVLNIGMLDERIGYAANFLAGKENILVVSRKDVGKDAAKKFAEMTGSKAINGRFMPGSLTNPSYKEFFEPDVLIVTDPVADKQAIKEALQMRIPIIGLADTFNETSYLDIILPCNNKAKKSLALVLWLLARELMKNRGKEFTAEPKDFGYD